MDKIFKSGCELDLYEKYHKVNDIYCNIIPNEEKYTKGKEYAFRCKITSNYTTSNIIAPHIKEMDKTLRFVTSSNSKIDIGRNSFSIRPDGREFLECELTEAPDGGRWLECK